MELINRGKKLLITAIVIYLSMEIAVILFSASIYYASGDVDLITASLFRGIVRNIFACLLFMFIYKGHNWARIIVLVLTGVSILYCFVSIIVFSSMLLLVILMLILLVPMFFLFFILLNKSVKAFQHYKKTGIIEDNLIDNEKLDESS